MRRLVLLFALTVPMLAWAGAFEAGEQVGRIVGLVLGVLFWVWVLFVAKWSVYDGQGGFWFRLGVLLLPVVFTWGVLREGFKPAARIFAFVYLLIWGAGFVSGIRAGRLGDDQSPAAIAAFKEGMVKGCLTPPKGRALDSRLTKEVCECVATEFVQTHTVTEAKAALRTGTTEYTEWMLEHVRGCVERGGVAKVAPTAPATEDSAAAALPEIAKTTCKVTSTPAGAQVFVNGQATGLITPADVTIYAGRSNRIEVKLAGYLPASANQSPNLNEVTAQQFTLSTGVEVRYDSEPVGAAVTVDGERVDPTPGSTFVSTGHHVFTFKKPGSIDLEQSVEAETGPIDLSVRLPQSASLRVQTFPAADVFVDGQPIKQTVPATITVAAGEKHFLTSTRLGYLPTTQVVAPVPPGDMEDVTLSLEDGNARQLRACVKKNEARVAGLKKVLAKLSASQRTASALQKKALDKQTRLTEHELGARQLELEACKSPR